MEQRAGRVLRAMFLCSSYLLTHPTLLGRLRLLQARHRRTLRRRLRRHAAGKLTPTLALASPNESQPQPQPHNPSPTTKPSLNPSPDQVNAAMPFLLRHLSGRALLLASAAAASASCFCMALSSAIGISYIIARKVKYSLLGGHISHSLNDVPVSGETELSAES